MVMISWHTGISRILSRCTPFTRGNCLPVLAVKLCRKTCRIIELAQRVKVRYITNEELTVTTRITVAFLISTPPLTWRLPARSASKKQRNNRHKLKYKNPSAFILIILS
jgi:hypothetical protein